MKPSGGSTRSIASQIVCAVVHEGRSLSQVAPTALATIASARDRAFVHACAYGVLRHYYRLKSRLDRLMVRPLRRQDAVLESLLLIGLYQLEHMHVPVHAAVSATVESARELGKPWACKLVNGVLRAAVRSPPAAALEDRAIDEYPDWLSAHIKHDWPDDWQTILAGSNAQAPLTLRVNTQRTSIDTYAAQLAAAGMTTIRGRHAPAALTLSEPVAVSALPLFEAGWVSVQDEAAQLAAILLAPSSGERILDACAAPGGKTAHLLELGGSALILQALDQSAERMHSVAANLARLGLQCRLDCADAGAPATWWDGQPFDKILLDAPCSALGVARRHPDIRLRRRPTDVLNLAQEQQRLLAALWPLLRVGGRLLYATCSIMQAENDTIIATHLAAHGDAEVIPLAVAWGRATRHGRQILPGEDDMDGFFYALLTKRAAC